MDAKVAVTFTNSIDSSEANSGDSVDVDEVDVTNNNGDIDEVDVLDGLVETELIVVVDIHLAVGSGEQWSYLGQHSPIRYSGSQSKRNLQSARAQVIELPWQ